MQVNFNSTLGPGRPPVNALIDEAESEEAMKRRFKAERRGAKRLKRELRRERLVGMQRGVTRSGPTLSTVAQPRAIEWLNAPGVGLA